MSCSDYIHQCENYLHCQQKATQICSSCKQYDFIHSQMLGRYCSRECQSKSFQSHKYIHKLQKRLIRKQKDHQASSENIPHCTFETIVIAIQEIAARHTLPSLDCEGTFSLLLYGNMNDVSFVYDELFEYLEHEYSAQSMSINHLHVILFGDDIAAEPDVTLGHVTVTHFAGPVAEVYSSLTSGPPRKHHDASTDDDDKTEPLSHREQTVGNNADSCKEGDGCLRHEGLSLAVLLHPTFSDATALSEWTPLLKNLIELEVPTVVTGTASASLLFRHSHPDLLATSSVEATSSQNSHTTKDTPHDSAIPLDALFWQGHNSMVVLRDHFMAHILVPCTRNALVTAHITSNQSSPAAQIHIKKRSTVPNATYMIFQSSSCSTQQPSPTPTESAASESLSDLSMSKAGHPAAEIIRIQRQVFLASLAISSRIEDDNTTLAATAEKLTGDLVTGGSLELPSGMTLPQLREEVVKRAEESMLPLFIQKQRARARAAMLVHCK